MAKKRERPSVVDMRALEARCDALQGQLTVARRRLQEVAALGVATATKLDRVQKDLDTARKASLRTEIENWGPALSRSGIGMRTEGWPTVVFTVGEETGRQIRLALSAREILTRGMKRVLEVMLCWEPTGEGAVDFDARVPKGERRPPKTFEAAAKGYPWKPDDHLFMNWAVSCNSEALKREESDERTP